LNFVNLVGPLLLFGEMGLLLKVVLQANAPKAKNVYPDGLVRIDYKDMHYHFAIQAKARVTRATVAMEKAQQTLRG